MARLRPKFLPAGTNHTFYPKGILSKTVYKPNLRHTLQRQVRLVVGGKYRESNYFAPAMLKYSATCDGSPKRLQVLNLREDVNADPHHGLIPAEMFNIHQMTGFEFRALMGKYNLDQ